MHALLLAALLAAKPSAPPKAKPPAVVVKAPPIAAAPAPAPTATVPVTAPVPPVVRERDIRQIDIDEKRANKLYVVHVALGFGAFVEFPSPIASAPVCGDCGVKDGEGLFRLDTPKGENFLVIKPIAYPREQGGEVPLADFRTTVNVRLENKLSLILDVTLVGTKDEADAKVVFRQPNQGQETAYVRDELTKAKKTLEAEYAGRIDEQARLSFLQALSQPHQCLGSGAHERKADIVLETEEICRFGADLYIRFTLENRSRSGLFSVGDVSVDELEGNGNDGVAQDVGKPFLAATDVTFGAKTVGVVGFHLADTTSRGAKRTYRLRISEDGGQGRALAISGLTF